MPKEQNEKLIDQVKEILVKLSKLDHSKVPQENGSIKFPEFYEVEEVKSVIEELTELGVNSRWLMSNGFVAAGMLLRIN